METRASVALLSQFETVFDSKILSLVPSQLNRPHRDIDSFGAPFGYFLAALGGADPNLPSEVIRNSPTVLVGAKDFRSPEGIGGVRLKFCYIAILSRPLGIKAAKYFAMQLSESRDGILVWKWPVANLFEERSSSETVFATQIQPSYLLLSNSLDDLQMVSRNLRIPGDVSEIPNGIREWESFHKYQFWGYRRYHRDDPLIDKDAAGLIDIPPAATALSLRLDLARKFCVLHLFITEGSADTIVIDQGSVTFRRVKTGMWEAIVPLSGDAPTLGRLFTVMSIFGFGGSP